MKAFLKENGMVVQAWYPLGHGDKALLEEPLFSELGKKYGKSVAQIILRWHIQAGCIVIPGSKNAVHIRANFDLFDFTLTADELSAIAAINKKHSLLYPYTGSTEGLGALGYRKRRLFFNNRPNLWFKYEVTSKKICCSKAKSS